MTQTEDDIVRDIFFNLEFNDAIRNIADLTVSRYYRDLTAEDIRTLSASDPALTEILNIFDQISDEDIRYLVHLGMNKSEVLGMMLVYLGPEKLQPYIADLLVYLQDLNWPAAGYIGILLRKMPPELMVPELIKVIEANHDDETWVDRLCSQLISEFNQHNLMLLKRPLIEFILNAKYEDSVGAARVMSSILTEAEFNQIAQYFEQVFSEQPIAMEEYKLWEETYLKHHL